MRVQSPPPPRSLALLDRNVPPCTRAHDTPRTSWACIVCLCSVVVSQETRRQNVHSDNQGVQGTRPKEHVFFVRCGNRAESQAGSLRTERVRKYK